MYKKDPYQNPHKICNINKDIEVEIEFETQTETIERLINDCINNMEDDNFSLMEELNYSVTLTVVKIEISKNDQISIINAKNTYKEDNCIVCLSNKPNILFCNCGHLVVCEECFKRLNNSKCLKCREGNTIIRKI